MKQFHADGLACLPLVAIGCLSADFAEVDGGRRCWAGSQPRDSREAVFRLDAELDPGRLTCSAVAIAENLVVTTSSCVVRPSEWSEPNLIADPEYGFLSPLDTLFATVDYQAVCERGETWLPREEGALAGRPGRRIEAGALSVFKPGGEEVHPVFVETSRPASRCTDGLAVLGFDQGLGAQPLPVRLEEKTGVGDPTTLQGYCRAAPMVRLDAFESAIMEVTGSTGSESLPPRALRVDRGLSALEVGGAMVSNDTGALVALIATGAAPTCESRDADGTTVGIRLAPFRRMIVDAAAELGATLLLESAAGPGASERVACP